MRTSSSLPRILILALIITLVFTIAIGLQARAEGAPPIPPIEIVEPEATNPDSTIVPDSLSGSESYNQEDLNLLNWVMILLMTTF